MSVTVLVGGQLGSEGKGKIAAYLAPEYQMAVRTGGPNAGHSFEMAGRSYRVQSVPCGLVNPECRLGIGAGGLIELPTLEHEIREYLADGPTRLMIDPQAAIIEERHQAEEAGPGGLRERIGSTAKGVGAALAEKVRRAEALQLAKNVPLLQPYLGDVAEAANAVIDAGGHVFLEGTQGFGLSLHHGEYPHVTGRDTTAGTLCGDAGISPRLVDEIILVVRTYPIRVAGPSGDLQDEIDWETVTRESGSPEPLSERTTVTNNVRRVGRFNMDAVRRAVRINRPTQITLTFVDYIDYVNRSARTIGQLTAKTRRFITDLQDCTSVPVTLIGTGPRHEDLIDLRVDRRRSGS